MNFLPVLLSVLASFFGLVLVIISHRLYKRYREKYLLDYFYFLLFFSIYGFFNFVGRDIARTISLQLSLKEHAAASINIVFNFMALPFFIISYFMLIKMFRALKEKRVPPAFKWGYVLYTSVILLLVIKIISDYIDSREPELSSFAAAFSFVITITYLLIIFLVIIHTCFFAKGENDKRMQKFIRIFGYLNLGVLAVYYILFFSIKSEGFYFTIMPFLYFLRNLPPFLYLVGFLKTYSIEYSPQFERDRGLNHFLSEFNITKREQRIIQLICEGKSNKEIEDILFISLQTVKHHIYNIYQKLEVKNRVQLTNLVRRYSKGENNEITRQRDNAKIHHLYF